MLFQLSKCLVQRLRHDARSGNSRHEVGIAVPARQDVQMKMALHASAGGPAKIHTEVVSVRPIFDTQRLLSYLCKLHELIRRLPVRFGEQRKVSVGRNHEMAAGIWKTIQNDEVVAPTIKNMT